MTAALWSWAEATIRRSSSTRWKRKETPERVVMVGWVNQSELLRFTVNADLGVLPYSAVDEYYSYAVPNKLMEYFEATLPMLYDVSMKEVSMVAGEHGVGVEKTSPTPSSLGRPSTGCFMMRNSSPP